MSNLKQTIMENKDQCVILKKKEYDQLLNDSKNMTGTLLIKYCVEYGMYGSGQGITFYEVGQPQRFILGDKLLSQIKRIAASFPDALNKENKAIISSVKDKYKNDLISVQSDYDFRLKMKDIKFDKKQEEFDKFKQKIAKMSVFEFIKFRKTLKENT